MTVSLLDRRPLRVLDLFCGAGGAARGYARAGFADVHGVDLHVQPQFPFLSIEQADALAVLADVAFCREFDLIHASPPCQAYSSMRTMPTALDGHPMLIDPVRVALRAIGRPYVIENVVGAPLLDPVMLCGSMFGLGLDNEDRVLRRHRLFEVAVPWPDGSGWRRPLPTAPLDLCKGRLVVGVYGNGGRWEGRGVKVGGSDAARALGVDWTERQAVLSQAIPPAYTEWIGQRLIEADVFPVSRAN